VKERGRKAHLEKGEALDLREVFEKGFRRVLTSKMGFAKDLAELAHSKT